MRNRMRGVAPCAQQTAKSLRHSLAPAERLLWAAVRGRRFAGCKFRRQHPIETYILDFYVAEAQLAVELDGASHDQHQEYDAERTLLLEARGVSVLRFQNREVYTDLASVLERIEHAIAMRLQEIESHL